MTYVDATLTPQASYTHVHNGQFYDAIAATMTAHPAWDYVEYVDAVNGANTHRRHIWKCLASSSGLPADFFVMFETVRVTATGLYLTTTPMSVLIAEGYSGGVLSKMASTGNTSITPASDTSNPATWTLTTYTSPAGVAAISGGNYALVIGSSAMTSARHIYLVTNSMLMSNWSSTSPNTQTVNAAHPLYVGAYDSTLGAVNDPMPLVACTYSTITTSSVGCGTSTRAPMAPTGVANTNLYTIAHYWQPTFNTTQLGDANPRSQGNLGTLGLASDTSWKRNIGGVEALRCYISTFINGPTLYSTRGVTRGYLKNVRTLSGSVVSHGLGDTFLIDGKVHVGLGNRGYGLWDTEAV